jgi:SAM-dependent methyltransferase
MIPWEVEERRLDARAIAAGDATGWFEELYAAAAAGRVTMPFSRAEPHMLLAGWTRAHRPEGAGRRAIVVGCGLGADAEHVARLGFDTVAFDVSPSAVAIARERHPDSPVRYVAADLLALPPEWRRAFDFVVEVITVQALPDPPRGQAIINVGRLVAPGGTLLAIADSHTADAKTGPGLPWPLRREEVEAFATDGLDVHRIEQLTVPGRPGKPRWRAEFQRA